jgi:gamma-aminobutyric acid type B receptor
VEVTGGDGEGHDRVIKMSSPNINNLVIAGSVLCYTTTLFANVEGNQVPLTAICTVRELY